MTDSYNFVARPVVVIPLNKENQNRFANLTNRLIAHLAHVELLTPKIDESIWFFENLLSMTLVKRDRESAYLRAWGEFSVPFSLRLTQSEKPGLGHLAWRADS